MDTIRHDTLQATTHGTTAGRTGARMPHPQLAPELSLSASVARHLSDRTDEALHYQCVVLCGNSIYQSL
jgi:hypothetical protein